MAFIVRFSKIPEANSTSTLLPITSLDSGYLWYEIRHLYWISTVQISRVHLWSESSPPTSHAHLAKILWRYNRLVPRGRIPYRLLSVFCERWWNSYGFLYYNLPSSVEGRGSLQLSFCVTDAWHSSRDRARFATSEFWSTFGRRLYIGYMDSYQGLWWRSRQSLSKGPQYSPCLHLQT